MHNVFQVLFQVPFSSNPYTAKNYTWQICWKSWIPRQFLWNANFNRHKASFLAKNGAIDRYEMDFQNENRFLAVFSNLQYVILVAISMMQHKLIPADRQTTFLNRAQEFPIRAQEWWHIAFPQNFSEINHNTPLWVNITITRKMLGRVC